MNIRQVKKLEKSRVRWPGQGQSVVKARYFFEAPEGYRKYPRIDLGMTGYRSPGKPGLLYSTRREAEREGGGKAEHVDTRISLKDLIALIRWLELLYFESRGELGDYSLEQRWQMGYDLVWDEGPLSMGSVEWHKPDELWDEQRQEIVVIDNYHQLAVYPVFGSNEGIYLHAAMVCEHGTHSLMTAKTLDASDSGWEKCWQSAMRIAAYLSP